MEMLIAMAISSILLIGGMRLLPLLQQETQRLRLNAQLHEELWQIIAVLEKAIRRAGYCNGTCSGEALTIAGHNGSCLLLRWDENHNGQWEALSHAQSEYYGWRLREQALETQRAVNGCNGTGWERFSDPEVIKLTRLQFVRQQQRVKIFLDGYSVRFPSLGMSLEHWVQGENLQ